MNICIFCSAKDIDPKYDAAARELVSGIAKLGHTMVWGGSNVGTMKVIADAAQEAGGKIIGVSVEHFRKNVRPQADEMYFAKDLADRKVMLMEKSDVFVALPGGTGTLDEISEMIELKKYEKHNKPIFILNTDGFYDGLKVLFDRMYREGFLMFPLEEIISFADSPQEILTSINALGKNN